MDIIPLGPGFAAELRGVTLADAATDDTAYAAVRAAASYAGASGKPAGNALLKSAAQLNAVAQPGTSQTLTDTVTNDGRGTKTFGLSSRTLGAYASVASEPVTLNDATGVATGVGAWSLTGRPEKYDRGGVVQIPQWFANRYTGGDTLGVGFGVAGSPRSQNKPAISARPSRAIGASRCSFGACCEQPA